MAYFTGESSLRYKFKDKDLKLLYIEEKNSHSYPESVVKAFFYCMFVIDNAKDLRDLYALKSLHFEKLSGNRKDQHSIRLNAKYRLTLLIENDEAGKLLLILEIVDYHK